MNGSRPSNISRAQRSELLRFDDPAIEHMSEYKYKPLPASKKRIRLLRLLASTLLNPSIDCELVEADYDNAFHIPTEVTNDESGATKTTDDESGAAQAIEEGSGATQATEQESGATQATEQEGRATQAIEEENRATQATEDTSQVTQATDNAIQATQATEDTSQATQATDDVIQATPEAGSAEILQLADDEARLKRDRGREEAKLKRVRATEKKLADDKARLKKERETENKLADEKARLKLKQELKTVKEMEIKYQALSWCWGYGNPDYAVIIKDGENYYKKSVRRDLALALKYLRMSTTTRTLWIDAICIDQANSDERNQQVQMMSRIYTRAEEVCIWLGEDEDTSELAIKFIQEEITPLKNFDKISSDKTYSAKWEALMILMQREWFSRRWVVQEIALAKKATVYCGPDSIPWKEFAVAVELFVEVETVTHRLSEVMQRDEKFHYVPGWFEHVSQLGASLLVQATGKVFRAHGTPMDDHHDDLKHQEQMLETVQTIDPLERRSLLSLEYLVTTMFIFKATECRDSIYSMLAIPRDAAPFAESARSGDDVSLTMTLFESFLAEKPFTVDYRRPYSDVCRDFVEFCILRKNALDPVQALDILCRPWALEPQLKRSIRLPEVAGIAPPPSPPSESIPKHDPVWQKKLQEEIDASKYWEMAREKGIGEKCDWVTWKARWTETERGKEFEPHLESIRNQMDTQKEISSDLPLPSWVSRAKNAPFELYSHPGIHVAKTGRTHADPLVGHPKDGHRNYKAAQTEKLRLQHLKFRKRPHLGHYSLYVAGFIVDEVAEMTDASQGGNIPRAWLDLGGWKKPYEDRDPPTDFWRTIVADRGHDNRNPPNYYARACKESVRNGGIASGMVNTTALIDREQNSIIAEFCRRVQAVIWGRSLFKTEQGKLGIAARDDQEGAQKGDVVCILYGCTVPVILSPRKKTQEDQRKEKVEDGIQAMMSLVHKRWKIHVSQARYEAKKAKHPHWKSDVEKMTKKVNAILETLKEQRKEDATRKKDRLEAMQTMLDKKKEDDEPGPTKTRSNEDYYYIFKGESYVHGWMDGEALKAKFYDNPEDCVLELR
jgi:hypothetical protein